MRDAAVALDDVEREQRDLLLDRGRLVAQYAVISFSYSLKSFASHRSCNIAAGYIKQWHVGSQTGEWLGVRTHIVQSTDAMGDGDGWGARCR